MTFCCKKVTIARPRLGFAAAAKHHVLDVEVLQLADCRIHIGVHEAAAASWGTANGMIHSIELHTAAEETDKSVGCIKYSWCTTVLLQNDVYLCGDTPAVTKHNEIVKEVAGPSIYR